MNKRIFILGLIFLAVNLLTVNAVAYVGPGAGLGAIGVVLALIGVLVLAIVGFVWYPIKRLLNVRKSRQRHKDNGQAEEPLAEPTVKPPEADHRD